MNVDRDHILVVLEDIHVTFGSLKALNGICMNINKGEILAIIGPNGAGKTTLINSINGVCHPNPGRIIFEGKDLTNMRPHYVASLGIARTFQNVALFKAMSVLDNITMGRHSKIKSGFFSQGLYWGLGQKVEIEHREAVEIVIEWLGIQNIRETPTGALPYGLQKKVELGRALAAEPKLLLLDEPMAGMSLEEKEDIARFILDAKEEFGTTICLIEHDMGVVMDVSDRIVVLEFGEKIAEGTSEEIRNNQRVINAYLGTDGH
jgi:branched-chain amino acid transport system ATP-binding protein